MFFPLDGHLAVHGGTEGLDEAVDTPLCIATFKRFAMVEVVAHMKPATIDLIEHFMGVLDQVFHSLQKRHWEAVRPHHKAGVPIESEHLL